MDDENKIPDVSREGDEENPEPPFGSEDHEARTLAEGRLSPRHRRLAQLFAEGRSNKQIKEEFGYSDSRLSVLRSTPAIAAEVQRIQDKVFEEGTVQRMKDMREKALSHVDYVLTESRGRVKITEKNDIAKWLIEMTEGKATQKHDIGENLLGVLMDKLDARKRPQEAIEIEARPALPPGEIEIQAKVQPIQKKNDDDMAAWIAEFATTSSVS